MIIYNKLLSMIKTNKLTKAEFIKNLGINYKVMERVNHDQYIDLKTVDKICTYFQCQPSDIMEWVSEEEYSKMLIEKKQEEIAELKKRLSQLED